MKDLKLNLPEGPVQGIGQEMVPCGPKIDGPIYPLSGEWSLQFSDAKPAVLSMVVSVVVTTPLAVAFEFCSEMDLRQVENLRDWLCDIYNLMNGKSDSAESPQGSAG